MVETQLSPGFWNPSGLWVVEYVMPIAWVCLFIFFIRQSIRARTLTFGLLLLISSTMFSWQDAYVNWGMYLLYNPKFKLMPWGTTLWTSPNKPWWVIPAYGFFWTIMFLSVSWMIARLRARFQKLGNTAAIFIVTIPFGYVWDLIFEASAVSVGWYSYVNYWGPAIIMSKGNFPLLYPILFIVGWAVGAVWFLILRGPDGRVLFESWFRVDLIRNRIFRGVARIGVWVPVMNMFHLVFGAIPLIVVREIFGIPSALVP